MYRILIIPCLVLLGYACGGQVKPDAISKLDEANLSTVPFDAKANLVYQDSRNNYWFGSKESGLYRLNGKKLAHFTKEDGLTNYQVIGVQEDDQGTLYFDTPGGIFQFSGRQFTKLEVEDASTGEWVLQPDDLWFSMGWEGKGPFRYDGEKLYALRFPEYEQVAVFYEQYPNASFSPYGIYEIYKDRNGHLWFGTSSLGIYHFDGETVRWMYEDHLTETPEGGAFGIRSIIEDKEGFVWICNANYKYKAMPDATAEKGAGALNYKRLPGINASMETADYYLSMSKDQNGDLWMLTYDNGVWKYDGTSFVHYPIMEDERPVLLLSLYIDNKGTIWAGTQHKGAYQFNGIAFEPFHLEAGAKDN